jgi:hypothetical protein
MRRGARLQGLRRNRRAVGLALLGAQFAKTKVKGGEVHYAVQMRYRLAVVAA